MDFNFNNRWSIGLLLNSPLYVLPIFIASSSYALAANNDTIIANGTERTLDNVTLENDANGTFIIQAKNGANFTANQIVLNSSGIRGGGAWIDSSKFTADDLQVNVTGNSATGIYLANNSVASLDNTHIVGQGSALGLVLDGNWSMPQGLATVGVTDSTITTDSGDAVRVTAGELMLNNVAATTTGNSSYAVNVNSAAKITIEGGTYSTHGAYSDAVWVASEDSSATINNAAIATDGDRAIAVNAQKGEASVTDSNLKTQGENAYGLYTEYSLQGDGLSIETNGIGSAGMFTALSGTGTLNNSTIITHGEIAPGLLVYPGSQITADNLKIETTGKEGFGLWSRAGTLDISNSSVSTTGEGATALYVNGYSSTSSLKNQVLLNNVTLSASQSQAIAVDTTDLNLDVQDSQISSGTGQLMTVTNYEDSLDPVNNLYSNVTLNAQNSTLDGDIEVSNVGNNVALNLTSGSVLSGSIANATSLTLDSSSSWNMSNNSSLGQLTNNGTVIFSDRNKFDTLNVTGNYAGDGGLLVMNSVLGDDGSPANKLVVGGDVLQGTTNVAINNLGGRGAQTVEGIEIVDVGGTSHGSFVKTGRIVAGAYDYDITQIGQNWYLTSQLTPVDPVPDPDPTPLPTPDPSPAPAPVPTPKKSEVVRPEGGSYTANLAVANTLFMLTLHDRLGETRFVDAISGQQEVTSLWLRQVGGHNSWHDDSGQLKTTSNRYVAQIGGDTARWSTDGVDRWHVGFMAGYGNSHSATENRASGYRSKGSIDGYSIGGYATWYANSEKHTGGWLDSWLQYGWFNNEVSGENLAVERYKSHGITASLEGGYSWKLGQFWGSQGTVNEWFVEPQAQAVWMGVRADDRHEANGTQVQDSADGNLLTRLGVKTYLKSHHARDNDKQREFQPFVQLNWLHNTRNFATNLDDVRVSQAGARNLAEVKVGLEGQIDPRLNIWGNVAVQMGDAGYNDSAAMIGMKYNF
jgi:autotransporter family porin